MLAQRRWLARDRRPTLDMLIDHVVHIADLVGPAHVGLGFDFADEGVQIARTEAAKRKLELTSVQGQSMLRIATERSNVAVAAIMLASDAQLFEVAATLSARVKGPLDP